MSNESEADLHNHGWGFALFIIILAFAANVTAFSIHKATHLQPRDSKARAAETTH